MSTLPAEDEIPVLFAATGGHSVQPGGGSGGEEPFWGRIKAVKETPLSVVSLGTRWHWEEAGGLLVLGRRVGTFHLPPISTGRKAFRGIYQALSTPAEVSAAQKVPFLH